MKGAQKNFKSFVPYYCKAIYFKNEATKKAPAYLLYDLTPSVVHYIETVLYRNKFQLGS